MYKVLHIIGKTDVGGIPTVVYNYCRNIDQNKIQIDIACVANEELGEFGKRFTSLGLNIYTLPFRSHGIKNFSNKLGKILDKGNYNAIHCHGTGNAYISLWTAKKHSIPQRIVHSHSSNWLPSLKSSFIHYSGKQINKLFVTNYVACGKLSGEKTFGKTIMKKKNTIVLPNAIDTNVFYFNKKIRNNMRNQLKLNQNFVLSMIGRIAYEKNIFFTLELMKDVHERIPNSILIIAGKGEQENEMIEYINKHNINDYVKFLGSTKDVMSLYNATDVLLMPSKWEGFPCAAVEAMATGLPVLMSTNITNELSFGKKAFYIPLSDKNTWLNTVIEMQNDTLEERNVRQHEVKQNGLDIKDTTKQLEDLYLNFSKLN